MTSSSNRAWVVWLKKLDRKPKPPCFNTEVQWLEWVAQAGDTSLKHKGPLLAEHCADCLPDYQQRMKEQGRCGHHTDIQFVKVGPGARAYEGRKHR
jgi:hypothetical protein